MTDPEKTDEAKTEIVTDQTEVSETVGAVVKPADDPPANATSSGLIGGDLTRDPRDAGTHLAVNLRNGDRVHWRNVQKLHAFGFVDEHGENVRIDADKVESVVVSRPPVG